MIKLLNDQIFSCHDRPPYGLTHELNKEFSLSSFSENNLQPPRILLF